MVVSSAAHLLELEGGDADELCGVGLALLGAQHGRAGVDLLDPLLVGVGVGVAVGVGVGVGVEVRLGGGSDLLEPLLERIAK